MQKEVVLEKLMDIAYLSFIKKDGTLRIVEAATTNINFIPKFDHPSGTADQTKKKENNPDLISFYDINVSGWRSCQLSQIQEIFN